MPWLLYRSIAAELLKVIGLTTAVLVTVIAFGATIKPLAGDSLLNAGQIARYLGLAIVPMLQYALPFAAGFGATLALHRMTADNEVQAMAAGGISYRRILLPVAGLGLGLGIIMVGLTQWVIPRFWSAIERVLAKDMTTLFAASIRRGEAFEIGELHIWADDIVIDQPDEPNAPQTRMILVRVAAAELDERGRVATDITSAQAIVDIYRRDGRTYLKLVMNDAVAYRAGAGDRELVSLGKIEPTRALALPAGVRDSPKAMTQTQLLALRRNPEDFGPIIEAKLDLITAIRQTYALNWINEQLRSAGQVELAGDAQGGSGERAYVIVAARLRGDEVIGRRASVETGTGAESAADNQRIIEIVQRQDDVAARRFLAREARLAPTGAAPGDEHPAFDLMLTDVEVSDLRQGGAAIPKSSVVISNLHVAAETGPDGLAAYSSHDLLAHVEQMPGDLDLLEGRVAGLRHHLAELQWEITGRLLNRYALSTTAVLLALLGAVLAMWLRDSLPLTIYLWSFMPSIIDLILISAGEQLLRDGHAAGHFVMWSGNAVILLVTLAAYRRLARH
jgi:lipopolysaccharide export LptBFGC system permease protein LptF